MLLQAAYDATVCAKVEVVSTEQLFACAGCNKTVSKECFSSAQIRVGADKRRCTACIEMLQGPSEECEQIAPAAVHDASTNEPEQECEVVGMRKTSRGFERFIYWTNESRSNCTYEESDLSLDRETFLNGTRIEIHYCDGSLKEARVVGGKLHAGNTCASCAHVSALRAFNCEACGVLLPTEPRRRLKTGCGDTKGENNIEFVCSLELYGSSARGIERGKDRQFKMDLASWDSIEIVGWKICGYTEWDPYE